MTFAPNSQKARREAILVAAASLLVAPVYFWWKGFDNTIVGIALTLGAFAILSARAAWLLFVRGLDTLTLDDDGVHLSRRNTRATFGWNEIHRVYRFGETLVFESQPPHRRYTFLFEGHDDHAKQIVEALAASARTMDLRWVDGLAELG